MWLMGVTIRRMMKIDTHHVMLSDKHFWGNDMQTITVSQILDRLYQLSIEKLAVVYDFVSYLAERDTLTQSQSHEPSSSSQNVLFASEAVLRRDWEQPDEDVAWANL